MENQTKSTTLTETSRWKGEHGALVSLVSLVKALTSGVRLRSEWAVLASYGLSES